MNLTKTDVVKASDERPNRMDGTCFYCRQPMGSQHKPDCVIVSKSVVVRVITEVVVSVPRDWDASNVNFQYQDSSYCIDNILGEIDAWAEKHHGCQCGITIGEFVRDATAEDHQKLPVLIPEGELP